LPHVPQLLASYCRSAHPLEHSVRPVVQPGTQLPPLQIVFAPQAMPQPPQFELSLVTSMQLLLQSAWPAPQLAWHVPLTHDAIAPGGTT
jgi:hypothetical protein